MNAQDKALHYAIQAAATEVRQRLSDANVGSTFSISITISGRLNSSDPLKVAYKVANNSWESGPEGNALTPVVDECLRRIGWNDAYSPTCLPAPEDIVEPPPAPETFSTVEKVPVPADEEPF
jgi:hypothetical protein